MSESGVFQGLRDLLPKLARPAWVRLIGQQKPKVEPRRALSREGSVILARKERKRSRLERAMAGERTRVSAA